MADRLLPTRQNPKLVVIDDDADKWQEFVDKRRLGTTNVSLDGKKDKRIDYVYSRVPLPKDLKGSGIFSEKTSSTKGHYYLMRRSSDGFISGTGMFRLAFPWATIQEEEAEKKHLMSLDGADQEEVAGNLWIPVPEALELADEYNIRNWILVLLDPSPVPPSTDQADQKIKSPPVYKITNKHRPKNKVEKTDLASGAAAPTPSTNRKRTTRSQSPEKSSMPAATPGRKIATPSRAKRERPAASSKLAPFTEADEDEEASDDAKRNGVSDSDAAGREASPESKSIRTAKKITQTPSSAKRQSLMQDAKAVFDEGKAAIERATDIVAKSGGGRKRKIKDVEAEDEAINSAMGKSNEAGPVPASQGASKRIKVNELEFRKEKLLKRTGMGIAASLAMGLMVPLVSGLWQSL